MSTPFLARVEGALYGLAIGDAMGAPVEGWQAERIMERFSDTRRFLPVTNPNDEWGTKGGGRITDDTLMTEALIRAYLSKRDHLDAYDYKTHFLPEIVHSSVWVPEKNQTMPILERLFWPERYPWIRLFINNAEPRTAGVGNLVNCGAAMYMMPVGAVNAGDPAGAYTEAVALASAHNESFALEAAAVTAACVAAAFGPGARVNDVLDVARRRARAGTAAACRAALDAQEQAADLAQFVQLVRASVRPYDQRSDEEPDYDPSRFTEVADTGRPSAACSIEELPVALAALAWGDGDYERTIRAAVFYGRDCDSSAAIAGALYGALHGRAALPSDLCAESARVNRRDFASVARHLADVAMTILRSDAERHHARLLALGVDMSRTG
jgi:ADP-ribosylglycohydrolase